MPNLVSIAVTPANASILIGATQQFTATGTYDNGSTANITATSTWTSSRIGVATIASTGIATAVFIGDTVISATLGTINGYTTLTTAPGSLYQVDAMEKLVGEYLGEDILNVFPNDILNALNDGYKDVSAKAFCIERADSALTISGHRLVPFTGHKVTDVLYGDDGESSDCCTIGYTTTQMQKDETQTLTALGTSFFPALISWAIASGGGSVSPTSGSITTVYTAPHTNPNCNSNPIINLLYRGEIVDSLAIAVNAYNASDMYRFKVCRTEGYCESATELRCAVVDIWLGTCAGVETKWGGSNWCGGGGTSGVPCDINWCDNNILYPKIASTCALAALRTGTWPACGVFSDKPLGVAWDNRQAYEKSQGCCPAALL